MQQQRLVGDMQQIEELWILMLIVKVSVTGLYNIASLCPINRETGRRVLLNNGDGCADSGDGNGICVIDANGGINKSTRERKTRMP